MIEPIEFDDDELEFIDERPIDYMRADQLFGMPVVLLDSNEWRTFAIVEKQHMMLKDMVIRGLLRS